jgi:hypothetical protein
VYEGSSLESVPHVVNVNFGIVKKWFAPSCLREHEMQAAGQLRVSAGEQKLPAAVRQKTNTLYNSIRIFLTKEHDKQNVNFLSDS